MLESYARPDALDPRPEPAAGMRPYASIGLTAGSVAARHYMVSQFNGRSMASLHDAIELIDGAPRLRAWLADHRYGDHWWCAAVPPEGKRARSFTLVVGFYDHEMMKGFTACLE